MARLHLAAFLVAAWCAASGVEVANSNPLKYRYTSGSGSKCATRRVVIPIGQRCGGDRNGCCQSGNIGSLQNQYPACFNPTPAVKPKYCTEEFTPWNCSMFTVPRNAICACSVQGDCTVSSMQNFNNIKDNQPNGYKAEFCPPTSFAHGNKKKIACQARATAKPTEKHTWKPTPKPTEKHTWGPTPKPTKEGKEAAKATIAPKLPT